MEAPGPAAGAARRGRGRRRFRSDSSKLKWLQGQQKHFAKTYRQTPYDDPGRRSMRETALGDDYKSAAPGQRMIRRAMGYYGPGDYRTTLKKYIPKGSFSYIGRKLGGMTGVPGLDAVGAFAGNKLANYVGFGDYTSNQIAGGRQSQISVNKHDMSGDIYINRTEFVQNVTVSGAVGEPTQFQVTEFGLNPGLGQTFPWLSQVASNFTLYEFCGLMFQYKPLFSEDAGSSSNLGKVIFATQYDPNAGPFRTSVEMENYDYANSTKPSCGLIHGVETANHQQALNMQYIRTGATTRDKIFTDVGTFQLGTEGIPLASGATSAIIGELWVTYYVKLSRAELYNSLLGGGIATDVFKGTWDSGAMISGTNFVKSTNSIGVDLVNISPTKIEVQFPTNISLGYYQIYLCWQCSTGLGSTVWFKGIGDQLNCQTYSPGRESFGDGRFIGAPTDPNGAASDAVSLVTWVYINSPGLAQASLEIELNDALAALKLGTWYACITQANANVAATLE